MQRFRLLQSNVGLFMKHSSNSGQIPFLAVWPSGIITAHSTNLLCDEPG